MITSELTGERSSSGSRKIPGVRRECIRAMSVGNRALAAISASVIQLERVRVCVLEGARMKRPRFCSRLQRGAMFLFGGGYGARLYRACRRFWASRRRTPRPLMSRTPHFPAKAKNCIFLLMEGGPSHIDTFDPKPKLEKLHMTRFQKERTKFEANMNTGERYYVRSPFSFRRAGKLGIEINSMFENFAGVVDDVCFYRGLKADSVNHPTALYHLNTGNQFGGDPAVGSWVSYGLGTDEPEICRAFVVLPDLAYPQGGAANWSNGYLPAQYQGTPLRPEGAPILDMTPPRGCHSRAAAR